MDKEQLLETVKDCENKPNKDLNEVLTLLEEEHNETKQMIYDLANHLDVIEQMYNTVSEEIKNRLKS